MTRVTTDGGARNAGSAASAPAGPAVAPARSRRGTRFQRMRIHVLSAGVWLIGRLPEGPSLRLADLAGDISYRTSDARRAQARRNLARVAEFAAGRGVGSEAVQAAASDPAALEVLVRSAFRNHARYWVELIRAPRVTRAYLQDRLLVETPDTVRMAFGATGPAVFIGLHFGVIEATAFFLAQFGGRPVIAPMETVSDPELQRWFSRTRGALGVRLVGLREARRELLAGLRSGAVVAIVGDRDLTGGGVSIELFGHPAPLPVGPALLAIESGAPVWVAGVRRAGLGRYRGRIDPLEVPAEGSRRERLEALLIAEARRFERIILDAPEQWWAVFYPIWPDLEAAA